MFQKAKRIIGVVLIVSFLFAIFYIGYIKITDNSPSFFGFRLLRVSSDSMKPAIDVGEIIIVKNVAPENLEFGDVISYRADKGYLKGQIVTHQISKEPYKEDGVYYFTTRGIRPEAVDDPEISEDVIIGEVLYKIPILGTVYDFFSHWYGIVLFFVLVLIIFADELLGFVKKFREEHSLEDDSDHNNQEDLKQSEDVINKRLNEFDGIITELDDTYM